MSWGWIVAAFLIGWLAGVWHSYRRVLKAEAAQRGAVGRRLFKMLEDADVIKFSVVEEDGGENKGEVTFDQAALDELLGNKTKH